MTPSSLNAGFRPASFSTVVPRRMPSSATTGSPSVNTGMICVSNAPSSCAVGGALVRARGVLVETGPREAPLLRDQLRGDALVEREIAIAGKHFRPVRHASGPRRTQRYPAHHLDTARHDDVLLAGHHGLHREVQRLLARPARAVDGGPGMLSGQPGGQHRVAADIARLVADLRDAAPHHVVDDRPGRCPARSTSALSTIADRSAACMSDSPPLRLPTGVRTASTITVSRIYLLTPIRGRRRPIVQ